MSRAVSAWRISPANGITRRPMAQGCGNGDGQAATKGAICPGRWNRCYQRGTNGTNASLGRKGVVLILLDGFRDGQAQLAEPQSERPPRDPEDAGSP